MEIYILFFLSISFLYSATAMAPPQISLDTLKLSNSFFVPYDLLAQPLFNTSDPAEQSCSEALLFSLNRFITSPNLGQIISNSGKGLNDFGDYESCKNLPDKYYLLVTASLSILKVSVGLCLPRQCTVQIMEITKGYIADVISAISGTIVTPQQIGMIDSHSRNIALNQFTTGTIVTLVALGIIVLWVLIATVVDYNEWLGKGQQSTWQKFMLCFSMQKNVKGILSTENRVDPKLEVLNGIRVLAIGWVVIGHSYFMNIFAPLLNIQQLLEDVFHSHFLGIIKAGTLSVDVFFFLSGFLAALTLYRAFKQPKNRTVKAVLLSYFYRYARLFPVLLLTILYIIYIQPLLFDAPFSVGGESFAQGCRDQWYQTLLYYNNFSTRFNELCNGWVWYLFIDMQLYIITPFIVIAYCLKKLVGYLLISVICVGAIIAQVVIFTYYDFNLSFVKANVEYDASTIVYMKPYCRLLPYFIGILLFIVYEEGKDKESGSKVFRSLQNAVYNSRLVRYAFYLIGLLLTSLIVYSFYFLDEYPDSWGRGFGIFHMLVSRPGFVIGLCMIIYPVFVGRGKILLNTLGHFVFNPLGKLTYGVYMLHLLVFYALMLFVLQGRFYSISGELITGIMVFCLSYVLSFGVTLVFESPIVQLLKTFVDAGRRRNATSETNKTIKGQE